MKEYLAERGAVGVWNGELTIIFQQKGRERQDVGEAGEGGEFKAKTTL